MKLKLIAISFCITFSFFLNNRIITAQTIQGCYLGAYLGCGSIDSSCITPDNFNLLTGKKHAFFTRYVDASSENNLVDTSLWSWANSLQDSCVKAKPVLFLMPMSGLNSVNSGQLDSAYYHFAQKCHLYNDTILLIFGHEMNGCWYPWGCDSTNYKNAFQRVYNIVNIVAPKVQFCWVPIQAWGQQSYTGFYPGDSYIDWVGLNVYDRDYDEDNTCPPDFFQAAIDYLDFYNMFSVQKNKPMLIGETALFDANWEPGLVTPTAQQLANEKNAWISQIYNDSILENKYPRINLICYFHVCKMEDFSTQSQNFGNIMTDWRIPLDSANNLYKTHIADFYFKESDADTCFTTSIIEKDIKNKKLSFNLHPNPANSKITIEIDGVNSNSIISIHNIQGQLLLQQAMQQVRSEINISNLAKGMYFIWIESEEGSVVGRFVKE